MSLVDDFDDPLPPRIDWSLWHRYLRRAFELRSGVLGVLGGGFGIAVIESVRPLVVAGLIDEAAGGAWTERLTLLFSTWVVLAFLFAGAVWMFIAAAGRLGAGLAFRLREGAFDKLQRLSFAYFDQRPVGWLLSRITSDCAQVSGRAPWVILDLFWAPLLMGSSAAAMLWLDARLAGLVLLVVPPLILVSRFFSARMVRSARRVRRTNSMMTAFLNEAIAGIRTTKTLCREDAAQAEFSEQTRTMRHWSILNARQGALYTPLLSTITAVGAAIALWQGGETVRVEGLTVGELVAFCQYAMLFAFPVQDLAQRFADLLAAQSAAERIENLLDARVEIEDSDAVRRRIARQREHSDPNRAEDGGTPRLRRLDLEAIRFRYPARSGAFDPARGEAGGEDSDDRGGPWTIDGVSLSIPPGQSLALVGPTGGGKTTLASLVARFYEPQQGRVLADGVDVRERSLSWLCRQLGVVQQAPWLFNDSIRENVRFARLDASDEAIQRALETAGAWSFVDRLEGGLDFEVGEGGERLSLGQRQLISLARAILKDPAVLVLDEATSSVDTETERTIQHAIDRLLVGRISIVVAHRLSTIRRVDRILFVESGRIVEDGSHEELLRREGGRYRRLYLRQFAEDRERRTLGD